MNSNSPTHARRRRTKRQVTPDENDFAALDAWARDLPLTAGRPLTPAQRRDESAARRVGRPPKPASAKARKVMISMPPALLQATDRYAKRTGHTLSGLIAESLAERIKRKAS